jgi:hypothetical protein
VKKDNGGGREEQPHQYRPDHLLSRRRRLIRSRRSILSSSPMISWLKRAIASSRMRRIRRSSTTLVLLKGFPPLGRAPGDQSPNFPPGPLVLSSCILPHALLYV